MVGEEILQVRPYTLDSGPEWVVVIESRRVFWLLPEYIGGTEGGDFFVGSSTVMAGHDGSCEEVDVRRPKFGLVMYNKHDAPHDKFTSHPYIPSTISWLIARITTVSKHRQCLAMEA